MCIIYNYLFILFASWQTWLWSLSYGICHVQAESLNAGCGLTGTSSSYQEHCHPQATAIPSAWVPKWVGVDSLANWLSPSKFLSPSCPSWPSTLRQGEQGRKNETWKPLRSQGMLLCSNRNSQNSASSRGVSLFLPLISSNIDSKIKQGLQEQLFINVCRL